MKALILNSGLGSRMGVLTKEHPKCMTEIAPGETIVSRQLRLLCDAGVKPLILGNGTNLLVTDEPLNRIAVQFGESTFFAYHCGAMFPAPDGLYVDNSYQGVVVSMGLEYSITVYLPKGRGLDAEVREQRDAALENAKNLKEELRKAYESLDSAQLELSAREEDYKMMKRDMLARID